MGITGHTVPYLDTQNTWSANQLIDGSTDNVQLVVQGNATQTSDIFVVEQNGGANLLTVSNGGELDVTGNVVIDSFNDLTTLLVQGNTTQTSDLLILEQHDGTDVLNVNNDGNVIAAGSITAGSTMTAGGNITANAAGQVQMIISSNDQTTGSKGRLEFTSKNDAAAAFDYARILCNVDGVTAGSESGYMRFYTMISGTLTEEVRINAGVYAPTATGQGQGVGTANFTGVYVDGEAAAVLSVAQSFTAAQRASETSLTSSAASIAVDLALNNDFSHTFTENTTLANPTNIVVGQSGAIRLTQHASSPKTLAFGSYWDFVGGTTPTVTATNSARDTLFYHVRSATQIETSWVGDFS